MNSRRVKRGKEAEEVRGRGRDKGLCDKRGESVLRDHCLPRFKWGVISGFNPASPFVTRETQSERGGEKLEE
jgi:hypothetical protein